MPSTPARAPATSHSSLPNTTSPPAVLPIVIAVVGALLLILAIAMFVIFRRRQSKNRGRSASRRGNKTSSSTIAAPDEIVSRTHPAALMITSSDGTRTPRFVHTPGTNMRTATRRPDGAWEFSDPRAPFRPSIIADVDAPRPSSSAYSLSRAPSPVPPAEGRLSANANELLVPPHTAASASPWGPPVPVPQTAASETWRRSVYSPDVSTAYFPSGSRRSSAVSDDSLLDERDRDGVSLRSSSNSNPFASPATSTHSPSRSPAPTPSPTTKSSPLSSAPSTAQSFPPHPYTPTPGTPRTGESRAAREIRLGYEALDRQAEQSASFSRQPATPSTPRGRRPLPVPTPSPASAAAIAAGARKDAEARQESRAARAIRMGYEDLHGPMRDSEYVDGEEGLPAY